MDTEPKLTDEEAKALLARLSRHYGEPVMPVSRYCRALRDWQRVLAERATRLRDQLFPDLQLDWRDKDNEERRENANKAYGAALRNPYAEGHPHPAHKYVELRQFESAYDQVTDVFRQITKSNLLARLLYNGEKLRTRECPEHKGKWSGIEWTDNRCPHGCQLTGWLPEPEDGGKPLPGVQAVRLIPTAEGEATMIRDVDGVTLGTVTMMTPEKE